MNRNSLEPGTNPGLFAADPGINPSAANAARFQPAGAAS